MKSVQAPCPHCGHDAVLGVDNPWRPFCSERCKLIDLGDWMTERYAIPAEDQKRDEREDSDQ